MRWFIVVASLGFALSACSSEPERAPLRLASAPAAVCNGAADRDGKNSSSGNSSSSGTGYGGSMAAGGWGGGGPGPGGGGCGGNDTGGAGGGCGEPGTGGTGAAGGGGTGGTGTGGMGSGGAPGSAGPSESSQPMGPASQPLAAGGTCAGIDTSTPLRVYLSSDDSNSMASPVIVRSQIERGASSVDSWLVRTWEFLNYYRFDFAPAPRGELSIVSQLGNCVLTGDLALQIAIQSEAVAASRLPMTLTLVLDTSGSMSGYPIELERAAVTAIASSLRQGDIVNAVTWSVGQVPVLDGYSVSGPSDPLILAMAAALESGGGTDLHSGLEAGYALANAHYGPDRINRVMLISDGQANVGITDESLIGDNAESEDAAGIYLVGVGVGDGVNDTLMDTVTDAGRGAYIFVDSQQEAQRMFVDRFNESILVAARGVRVELTLPGYFKIQKFFGEEYSPDPTKVRPQHLAPDDSMILYQILRPCDPSLPSASDFYQVRVTWQDPFSGQHKEAVQATTLGQLGIDDGNLSKAAAVVAYAETLKQLDGNSPDARAQLLEQARQTALEAGGMADVDLAEIIGLIDLLIAANQQP